MSFYAPSMSWVHSLFFIPFETLKFKLYAFYAYKLLYRKPLGFFLEELST